MRLARALAVALTLCLVSGACSDGSDQSARPPGRRPPPLAAEPDATEAPRFTNPPAPTPTPGRVIPTSQATWADGLPALIVSNGSDVRRYRRGAPTLAARVDGTARIAYSAGAATVIVQREFDDKKRSELLSIRRGRDAESVFTGRAFASLMDVATIAGERSVLFTTYYRAETTDTTGYLYIQNLQSGRRRRVTDASGPEYGVTRASFGGSVIAVSASADLTEVFSFMRADGTEVSDPPSPTEKLPYGVPPYMTDAVLSPDGKTLAYLEGPDFDQQEQEEVGNWVLVVRDQTNAREIHRVQVAEGRTCIPWLDFDGRWAVFSRTTRGRDEHGNEYCGASGSKPRSVAVLDTHADDLGLVELTNVVGMATIDD